MPSDDIPALTPAEYEEARRRLDELRTVRDRDLPRLLREARGFVSSDAAEEIVQLQEDFSHVEGQIARLERLLDEARVVAPGTGDRVALGHAVTVQYQHSGRLATFMIGGHGTGTRVSARSPMGQALLGRASGDSVEVALPDGRVQTLRILEIGLPPAAAA